MDKRAALRNHFQTEASRATADKQYKDRTKQLDDMENTVVDGFTALIRFLDGKTTKTEVVNQLKSISTPDIDKLIPLLSKLDTGIRDSKLDLKPLVAQLNGIKREMSLVPKTLPKFEQKDSVKVTNLDEVKFDTSKLEKLIKDLKLNPTIEVKPTDVQLDAPDLKPLETALKTVVEAIKNQKFPRFPELPKTDLTKVEKKLDESNKHLKKLVDKPTGGGGGGGGNGTPYIDSTGKPVNVELEADGSIPVSFSPSTYKTLLDDTTTSNVTYIGNAPIGTATSAASWQIQKLDETTGLVRTWAGTGTFNQVWDNRATTVVYS